MLSDLRMAVVADVHGNAYALEAVIAEVRAALPDIIVNLGDQVWGRADPARAYALQQEPEAVEVRGNNDEKLARAPERLGAEGVAFRDWLLGELPNGAADHLVGLPLMTAVADGRVLLAHGTPQDANQELL